jgi:hypothetical protein
MSANCRRIQMGRMLFNEWMPCSSDGQFNNHRSRMLGLLFMADAFHLPHHESLEGTKQGIRTCCVYNEATCVRLGVVVRISSGSTMEPGTGLRCFHTCFDLP